MDDNLSRMIQETIDALTLAQAQLASVMNAMRRQSVNFGPEYRHLEEDMTRILDDLTYMLYLAENQNGASG
jgi:hypothetical protein